MTNIFLTFALRKSQQLYVCKTYLRNFSVTKSQSIETISSQQVDLDAIKREFRSFEGGQVSLTKNEEGIASICLDHPLKKNGFSGKMMVDLSEIVTELEMWTSGKAVILHSNGDTFCSGGYIKTVKRILNSEAGFKMCSLMVDSLFRLAHLPLVSVSLVQGKAIGGGAELLLATDFRLFTPTTEVQFVEAKMGVGTGWGGGTSLKRLLGHSKALELLLSCRKITPDEAVKIGLADDIILGDNILEKANEWIKNLVSSHDPIVVHTMKQIVSCDNYEKERLIFAKTWGGQAQAKALGSNIKHK